MIREERNSLIDNLSH